MPKWIEKNKTLITDSKEALQVQVAFVDARLKEADDTSRLQEIQRLQSKLDEAGVANNPHTVLSALDAKVMWDQYSNFLNTKKKTIEDEILANKNRGVTQEQLTEIKQQFGRFDADGSGKLDRLEFKTCLYSLNDERPAKEIKAIMAKVQPLDDPNHINYEGFFEFMLSTLGDSDTKEEIINGFAQIMNESLVFPPPVERKADAKESKEEKEKKEKDAKAAAERKFIVRHDRMDMYMDEWTIHYIENSAPPVDGGWEYVKWTESVFAR